MQKYIPMLLAAFMLTGCGKGAKSLEAREESDPNIAAGQAYMEEGKYDEAIAEFKKVLDTEPLMARPHLDLATIYQNNKLNYIHAIYHYDRYLELRPDSEKTEFINEQKLKVAQALANTLINNSKEVKQVVQERNSLLQQNNELKRQLASAQQNPQPAATTPPAMKTVTQTVPKSAPQMPATQPDMSGKHQIYHVVSGDNLTKIATKFYGDGGKWDIILDANKDTLGSPRDLKVGQTLVIPAVGN